MISRHRYPDGRNADVDLGPGPVGSVRGYRERSIGASLLTDAIAPSVTDTYRKHAGGKPKRDAIDKSATLRRYWASPRGMARRARA